MSMFVGGCHGVDGRPLCSSVHYARNNPKRKLISPANY